MFIVPLETSALHFFAEIHIFSCRFRRKLKAAVINTPGNHDEFLLFTKTASVL
jgi:3',5'-cyclic AMP phosphodiesterase CpdA